MPFRGTTEAVIGLGSMGKNEEQARKTSGMEVAQTYGTYMSTASFDSAFASRPAAAFSRVKSMLLEPFMIVGVAAFWLVALPFVALSLVCVKVGDALAAMESASAARPNPLFLRRSRAPEGALILLSSSDPIGRGRV